MVEEAARRRAVVTGEASEGATEGDDEAAPSEASDGPDALTEVDARAAEAEDGSAAT
jgi:hypothetical protein